MFKTKEDNLRSTQTKLTTAAGTIRKQILNVRSVKEQFNSNEIEVLESAEKILLSFKDKVKHAKEKHIRAKKAAERVEANVKAENQTRVKKVVNSIPVSSLFELSLMRYYRGDELAEEIPVKGWEQDKLREAAQDPNELSLLLKNARAHAVNLFMEMLPKQEYRGGFIEQSREWDDYCHVPESSSVEFITELVKRQIRDVPITKPQNIEYVNEAVRLVNLARSVNQTIREMTNSSK
ncbi:hypothetical protein [Vibrio parahaemolyticus]|uniref:hypothetical protein n=1 Tax=Vibrio parahaemolyticus TaxID=670 RepID=UPI0028080BD1|nr:hypothetical protein [Vibrio parahaemolyticus]ELA9292939.1 hypothetical protein [Vibrio parahaemolyticus]MDS1925680.1 hypothetical protein [Vibrio parahaemolyticus]